MSGAEEAEQHQKEKEKGSSSKDQTVEVNGVIINDNGINEMKQSVATNDNSSKNKNDDDDDNNDDANNENDELNEEEEALFTNLEQQEEEEAAASAGMDTPHDIEHAPRLLQIAMERGEVLEGKGGENEEEQPKTGSKKEVLENGGTTTETSMVVTHDNSKPTDDVKKSKEEQQPQTPNPSLQQRVSGLVARAAFLCFHLGDGELLELSPFWHIIEYTGIRCVNLMDTRHDTNI